MPFLGQKSLYDRFHLDEPWDSEHNRGLVESMPKIYRTPGASLPPGHTMVGAPAGPRGMFSRAEPTSFASVIDGLSNTILIVMVQSDRAVVWTRPEDYSYDTTDPLAGIDIADGRWIAALGDGAVRRFKSDLSTGTVNNLFDRADKNVVEFD